jgi:hypothetical protein
VDQDGISKAKRFVRQAHSYVLTSHKDKWEEGAQEVGKGGKREYAFEWDFLKSAVVNQHREDVTEGLKEP